jgi:hypothetical protein
MRTCRYTVVAVIFLSICLSVIGCQSPPAPRTRPASDPVTVNVDQDVAVRVDKNGNVHVRTPDGNVSVRPTEILSNQAPPQQAR